MFVASLFTVAKTWTQTKCPSADEWIKTMRYTYPMEYYPAIKKNEIMPFAATWMDIDIIILSEVSQKNRTIPYSMVSLTVKESESQSCLPLCDPMDCSLPGSSIHWVLQARVLEYWLPFPSPGDLPNPGIKCGSLALQTDTLLSEPPGKHFFFGEDKAAPLWKVVYFLTFCFVM